MDLNLYSKIIRFNAEINLTYPINIVTDIVRYIVRTLFLLALWNVILKGSTINLNTREMYIKMSVDGKLTPPFSAKTVNVPKAEVDYSRDIIDNSRVKYGSNKTKVENDIKNWSNSAIPVGSTDVSDFPEPII